MHPSATVAALLPRRVMAVVKKKWWASNHLFEETVLCFRRISLFVSSFSIWPNLCVSFCSTRWSSGLWRYWRCAGRFRRFSFARVDIGMHIVISKRASDIVFITCYNHEFRRPFMALIKVVQLNNICLTITYTRTAKAPLLRRYAFCSRWCVALDGLRRSTWKPIRPFYGVRKRLVYGAGDSGPWRSGLSDYLDALLGRCSSGYMDSCRFVPGTIRCSGIRLWKCFFSYLWLARFSLSMG